jgi:type I restriction enzyme, S subunit
VTAFSIGEVELLGGMPEHWAVKPLKWCVHFIEGPGILATDFVNDGVPLLRIRGLSGKKATLDGCNFLLPDLVERKWTHFRVEVGDLLISGSASTGLCSEVDEVTAGAIPYTGIIIVRPRENRLDRNYTRWFFLSDQFLTQVALAQTGSTIQHFGPTHLSQMYLWLPPLQQQRTIADYLDRETARLDGLVAAKEHVLGLLTEKRRALITRTVTRGLDPTVSLRDSGLPWFGEIPAHWEKAQLRRFTRFITSGSRGWAEHYSDSGSIFVRIGNLTRDSIRVNLRDIQYVDPPPGAEGERTQIQIGDLLFSITAYLGSVAVAPSTLLNAYVNQHIALVRLDPSSLVPEFVGYAALSDLGQSQLAGQAYGGTKTQLALDDIRELWFPIPSLSEQHTIVAHIAKETAKLDALREATERTIRLLKERRAALIAAAVTGKLAVIHAA